MDINQIRETLAAHNQEHVLAYWDQLHDQERTQLGEQLQQVDFDQLATLVAGEDDKPDFAAMAARAETPPSVGVDGAGASWSIDEARKRGEDALRGGQVGAVLVAGGQGSRLGFDHPKGMYKIGPVSDRTLFQIFADQILAMNSKYGIKIPLYLMTSPATDAETKEYFEANDYLGLDRDCVRIFCQGTMPAVDMTTGKLLLQSKSSLALSPDGHGGTVGALNRSGAMQDAVDRGISQLFYFQVDNPLVSICDPVAIGHHLMAESELTTLVVRKRYPTERVGNVVKVDGRVQIIEYSDLPDEAANKVDDAGELQLWAGNIAIHVMALDFLKRAAGSSSLLPFHRAQKKVTCLDSAGNLVTPDEPNGIKFERFIFDLLPSATNAFVVEVAAADSFAPVKNADGAETDTPELARKAIAQLHSGWLSAGGAVVASDAVVEINPAFATDAAGLAEKIDKNQTFKGDVYLDV